MLESLCKQLISENSSAKRCVSLESLDLVHAFFKKRPFLETFVSKLSSEKRSVLYQLIAIGQAEPLFSEDTTEGVEELLETLERVDRFYKEIGGLVGYQLKIQSLLSQKEPKEIIQQQFHAPSFIDIKESTPYVQEMVDWGIESLEKMAEIYPLGGAADRLHLVDRQTGIELPAAKLPFRGQTLLEILIRDLEAREHLYYLKKGRQIVTPIAIMTSHEKNNHAHVLEIFEENNYFGRPKDSIRFFSQPLVPAVQENGNWCIRGPMKPLLKPGGHGAIWKLARDEGIFEWLFSLKREKAIIRQINNPLAGLDYGLLALIGIGCKEEMVFGFASCPRLLKSAEGVNVLVEKDQSLVLTNIEYCDFAKFGIEDRPLKPEEPYSRFSSNTNILFADLKALDQAVQVCPFPGLLINLKEGSYTGVDGKRKRSKIARLESTMQNIADVFVEPKEDQLKTKKTFVTYNKRHKTISTAKKAFIQGGVVRETPENCFFDLMQANRELLLQLGYELPESKDFETSLQSNPEFLFLYHPTLGPTYSIIESKIQKGKISSGSELLLNISDLKLKNLKLNGSLRIIAEQPIGHVENGSIQFSDQRGSCILENVTIDNLGVDWDSSKPIWKMDLKRKESVTIILKGRSKFVARDLHLQGNHTFVVEDGKIMKIL